MILFKIYHEFYGDFFLQDSLTQKTFMLVNKCSLYVYTQIIIYTRYIFLNKKSRLVKFAQLSLSEKNPQYSFMEGERRPHFSQTKKHKITNNAFYQVMHA